MKSLLTSLLLFLFISFSSAVAQQNTVQLLDKSTMQIEGTSNVHDWTANVEQLNADINFNASALSTDSIQNPVNALTLTIPVEQMESGKGGMNRRMHDALKKDKHPNITYELTSAELTEKKSDSTFQLNTTGTLTIAGISRTISSAVEGSILEDGSYKFTGSQTLNMKDYKVDPPSAMFGAIKSGETVTVVFELFFK
jgi:polyisoprenoid-binding protein YceI